MVVSQKFCVRKKILLLEFFTSSDLKNLIKENFYGGTKNVYGKTVDSKFNEF